MKSPRCLPGLVVSLPLLGAVLGSAAPDPGGASAPVASSAAAPKPYLLYLGADIDVQRDQEYWRVRDIRGDAFIATRAGQQRTIPTDYGAISLRIRRSLKLADATITIANLKSDRTYTPGNDPVRRFFREQPGSTGLQRYDYAQGHALVLGMRAAGANPNSPNNAAQADADAAEAAAVKVAGEMNDPVYDPNEYAIRMQNELAQKLFDALEITFDVSGPAPFTTPYVLIVAQYRERDAPPHAVHNWIYAQTLDPIDRSPHRVTIRKGGFPKGFELQGLQLHLYDHGRELATTVADRPLALTHDQAFQYVLLDYLSSHPGANVPATPALVRLPPDLRVHVSDAQFTRTYYVKVTRDGLPTAAYGDPDCRTALPDSYLQAVMLGMRFTPRLEKGVPIEGVALVNLSRLHSSTTPAEIQSVPAQPD